MVNKINYFCRCDALEFKLSKSQKKILKRMNRFLRDGLKDNNCAQEKDDCTEKKVNDENKGTKSTAAEPQNDVSEMELDDTREIVDIPNLPIKNLDLGVITSNIESESKSPIVTTQVESNEKIPANTSDTNEKCK